MKLGGRIRQSWQDLLIGSWDPADPSLWPSPSQRLLLRALLLDGEPAARAWREWRATHDLESADVGDQALFSSLYLEAKRLAVEPEVRNTLRAVYAGNWVRNQTALKRLAEVLQLFEESAVPAITLKGAALLLVYYGDVGARPMDDIDVLVRESDLVRAANVLEANGWRAQCGVPPREIIANIHGAPWTHPSGFNLDLHWRPYTTDCPTVAEERFWQHSEVHRSAGGQIRVPGAADFLILMCFHGRKYDRPSAGRWVVDAMKVIERADPPIDWGYVLEQCKDTGLLLPVRDALNYLVRELDAAVPDDFLRGARSVPARPVDMVRYHYVARGSRVKRGLAEVVAGQWWRYAAVCRSRGGKPRISGFIRYYLACKQWEWRLAHKWQVPARAVRTAIWRLRSHGV